MNDVLASLDAQYRGRDLAEERAALCALVEAHGGSATIHADGKLTVRFGQASETNEVWRIVNVVLREIARRGRWLAGELGGAGTRATGTNGQGAA